MASKNKYVCIHGHFYQPPRENAWLDEIEIQESAYPFHDWNERINFECYAPNTSARILDHNGLIHKIINNYTYLSYNFGPTLLSWMERTDKETYNAILESDKISKTRFGGHGSAIAQAHSHLILPLANHRDKVTQVKWGLRDFEYRYGRKSEGIWLAETAVDTATLEVLAEEGLKYTILAPRQMKAFRKIGAEHWTSANNGYDTRRPYIVNLPSGRSIALFFYDGQIAQDVAFKGLLNDGNRFADHITNSFDHNNDEPQLVHIATDGETYGHHHRHGEMALASCLHKIDTGDAATLTNYGEYLEKFPPTWEAQIHDNSSWSCVHGVERWKSNCGCNSGRPGWHQEWRGPLRNGLDWLRDYLESLYEREAGVYLKDPWVARDEYIDILIKRDQNTINEFMSKHATKTLDDAELTVTIRLLELQKFAMYMYTSCGWFFDEISGIETNQILQYALRAMQYVRYFTDEDVMSIFSSYMEKAPSNVFENGGVSYNKNVVPSAVNLERVAMHFAVASVFDNHGNDAEIYRFRSIMEDYQIREAGNQRLAVGKIKIRSKVTYREKSFKFVVVYLGQQNIIGNIGQDMSETNYAELKESVLSSFDSTNLGEVLSHMQKYFADHNFTIWHLFKDEKRKILDKISAKSLENIENSFREIYNDNYQLMSGMALSNIPIPNAFTSATEFILNTEIHAFFSQEVLDITRLRHLSAEFEKWNLKLNNEQSFKYTASERIFYEVRKLALSDFSIDQLVLLNDIFNLLKKLNVSLDIWKSQNLYFGMLQGYKKSEWVFANKEWEGQFQQLGHHLGVKL